MSEVQHGQEAQAPEVDNFEAAFAQVAAEEANHTPNPQEGQGPAAEGTEPTTPPLVPDPNDPLAKVDVATLLSHPTLGPVLKSHIDTEHAAQSRGMQQKWQQDYESSRAPQIQQQVTERLLGEWFDGMGPEELGTYLAENPNLASAYGSHKAAQEAAKNPPTVDPNNQVSPETALILGRIRAVNQRLSASGLPDEVRATLDPGKYRDQGNAGLEKWEADTDAAIIAHKVKLQTAETLEAKRTADLAENDTQSGLFSNGAAVGVLGDLENDPPQLLMERALAIEAAARKR